MKKVLLGMSGGVDSAVSAILLKEKGYEVIGANLELFGQSNTAEINQLCNLIGIKFYSFDCKNDFKKYVIDDFVKCYSNCKTPNPCIECNKYFKFNFMWKKAQELGCDYIATGHYAGIEFSNTYQKWVIKKSKNISKDQSYVLWNIPSELIEHIIFPLSDFSNKNEIRQIALSRNLPVASKPDSEDICFIPDGNYKKFLEENSKIKPNEGNIVLTDGTILGKHNGLYNYTIGQRKGMGIAYKEPLFVIGFDKTRNEVIVGEKNKLYKKEMLVTNLNWLAFDKLENTIDANVKTRYSQLEQKASIQMIDENIAKVTFDSPAPRITPGQSAVFYIDDVLIGGGKII